MEIKVIVEEKITHEMCINLDDHLREHITSYTEVEKILEYNELINDIKYDTKEWLESHGESIHNEVKVINIGESK